MDVLQKLCYRLAQSREQMGECFILGTRVIKGNLSFCDCSHSAKDCITSNSMDGVQDKTTLLALQHKIAVTLEEENERKPIEYLEHIFWSDETKIKFVRLRCEPGQDYQ